MLASYRENRCFLSQNFVSNYNDQYDMVNYTLVILAFVGGVLLALQGAINSQLGVLLKNPLLASLVAFGSSAVIAFLIVTSSVKNYPNLHDLRQIPYYFWFLGGLCSVMGLVLYYYTIPKLGMATMISLGLSGQLLFSVFAGHFGWFNLPVQPVDWKKLLGVTMMAGSIFLINNK